MIKIGDEKLFTMTELLENFQKYLDKELFSKFDIQNECAELEIRPIAAIIEESADFVRGFVTSRREG